MHRTMFHAIFGLLALAVLAPGATRAADPKSPAGLWKTFDDKTGAAKAIIRIYEQDGKLFGRIETRLVPGVAADAVCSVCKDERKDQPVQGLVVIRNMKSDGDEYDGGDILDPENGSVYRCKMHVEGTNLVVRGYLGISLLGRTQTWQRQPEPSAAITH